MRPPNGADCTRATTPEDIAEAARFVRRPINPGGRRLHHTGDALGADRLGRNGGRQSNPPPSGRPIDKLSPPVLWRNFRDAAMRTLYPPVKGLGRQRGANC